LTGTIKSLLANCNTTMSGSAARHLDGKCFRARVTGKPPKVKIEEMMLCWVSFRSRSIAK